MSDVTKVEEAAVSSGEVSGGDAIEAEEAGERDLAGELVERARTEGIELVGPDGLLGELTKEVLETALEAELSEHLGYDIGDPRPGGYQKRFPAERPRNPPIHGLFGNRGWVPWVPPGQRLDHASRGTPATVVRAALSSSSALLKRAIIKTALAKAQKQRAERLDVEADRVMIELARIAFADITDVIQIKGGEVTVTDTAKLSEGQRAAIAAIEENKSGLKIRMHQKAQALESLAKHFGLLIEKHSLDVSLTQRGPLELLIVDPMTPAEAAEASGDAPAAEGHTRDRARTAIFESQQPTQNSRRCLTKRCQPNQANSIMLWLSAIVASPFISRPGCQPTSLEPTAAGLHPAHRKPTTPFLPT